MIEWLGERRASAAQKGTVQAARLGILPSALLGRADPDRQVRQVRLRSAAGGSASARAAERAHLRADRQRRVPARAHDRLGNTTCPCCGAPGKSARPTPCRSGQSSSWYFLRYGPAQPRRWPPEVLNLSRLMLFKQLGHTTLLSAVWPLRLLRVHHDISVLPTKTPRKPPARMILGSERIIKNNDRRPDEIS